MNLCPIVAVVGFAAVACGVQEGPADVTGDWVGTITTKGNVTTVVNESGSVWGGTATLVEEASIGVEAGANEYMFGNIAAVYASADRIYVVDDQVPIVRSYDLDGNFINVIGGAGEGPGEYRRPQFIGGTDDGRIFVEADSNRMNVYSPSGESLADFEAPAYCCNQPTIVTANGIVYRTTADFDRAVMLPSYTVQGFTEVGAVGDPIEVPNLPYERLTVAFFGTQRPFVPFAPAFVWNMTRAGSLVVGTSDRYRFEIRHAGGSSLIVERNVDAVAVLAEEREPRRKLLVAAFNGATAPSFTWDGASMPDHKPAFGRFVPAYSGELWVIREGPSTSIDGCVEDPYMYQSLVPRDTTGHSDRSQSIPCWRSKPLVDVFDAEGVYLGEVEIPDGMKIWEGDLFVSQDVLVATHEDEAGTLYVKRYRLVLPGER